MKTVQEQENEAILRVFEQLKALEVKLAIAQERIRQLEAQIYGDLK